MQRMLVLLVVAGTLSGCVSARATMLGPSANLTPVPEDQVRIFLEEEDVHESCEEIALIDAQGNANATNRTQMLAAVRRRAGTIGANAFLAPAEVEEPSTGRQVASALLGLSADRRTQTIAYLCDFEEEN